MVHGYLLHGTGSNIYVASIAKAWGRLGHAVTVVCQDRDAAELPFVNEYIGSGEPIPKAAPSPGVVRVVVPDINGLLPVYVLDKYDGYRVKTIPEISENEIRSHVKMTAASLSEVCSQGADAVLANHALFGPLIARDALVGAGIPYSVKIHGSAMAYVLAPHPEFMRYALEGLSSAEHLYVGTQYVKNRVLDMFGPTMGTSLLDERIRVVSPGLDPEMFELADSFVDTEERFLMEVARMKKQNVNGRGRVTVPLPEGRDDAAYHETLVRVGETYDQRTVDADLPDRWPALEEGDPIILYFGKFLAGKGVGELAALIPEVLSIVPNARFIFVGFGAYREHLEGLLQALRTGSIDLALACAHAGDFAREVDIKSTFRKLTPNEADRATVTGMLDHEALSKLLPLASVTVVPSKVAEAFGMVAVESMASGVLPICKYHSGLKDVVDEMRSVFPELEGIIPLEDERFFELLPASIGRTLSYLFPAGPANAGRKQELGVKLRRFAVS